MQEFSIQNNTNAFYNKSGSNSSSPLLYDLAEEKKLIALGIEELKKEIRDKWNRKYAGAQIFSTPIAAMHPEVVDFLLSFNLVDVYDYIAKQNGLDENGRNILPKIVWKIAQSKDWNSLESLLQEKLPNSSIVNISQLLKDRVLDKVRNLSEKTFIRKDSTFGEVSAPVQQLIKLSLPEALSQYPKIAEQSITINQIMIRSLPTLARPSIKNWISDYHDKNGVGKHSPIDRGNYLFHSENGKKLSPSERQKLGTILKSLDEQSLLIVDSEKQIIVFENEILNTQKVNTESRNLNEEPADIFDLKINTIGKSLKKNTVSQNIDVSPGVNNPIVNVATQNIDTQVSNKMETVQLRNVPANLPIEKFDLENNSSQEKNRAPVQIGSTEFNEVKIDSDGLRKNLEDRIDSKTFDFKEQYVESKIESRPMVELKNISFSPNFALAPKDENAKSQTLRSVKNLLPEHLRVAPLKNEIKNALPLRQKEELFSLPSSKPPIGTDYFDVSRAREEKISAMAHRALEALPSPVLNTDEKVIDPMNVVKEVSLTQKREDEKKPDVSVGNVNLNDLDSMSDEMLFKLYQEKKNSTHNTAAQITSIKPRGFHIGSANPLDENEKVKNVVDLKNL
ncbi:MAG: hypothetical protein ACD_5C00228G0004 [uncultured bacterium]|nr:MAG: hypothetical protein ACD_5C00228G0004 [uncultured bacterium]